MFLDGPQDAHAVTGIGGDALPRRVGVETAEFARRSVARRLPPDGVLVGIAAGHVDARQRRPRLLDGARDLRLEGTQECFPVVLVGEPRQGRCDEEEDQDTHESGGHDGSWNERHHTTFVAFTGWDFQRTTDSISSRYESGSQVSDGPALPIRVAPQGGGCGCT